MPAALGACTTHTLEAPRPLAGSQVDLFTEVSSIRKLDLLFVVDNSGSMREEQENLARNFPAFIRKLRQIPGVLGPGLPDIRIGIISTDVGAGPETVGTCSPLGDRGRLLVREGCGLDRRAQRWIAAQNNGARTNLEPGTTIEEAFACMAQLGTTGCGFEHHLQAVRAALSPQNLENQGFVRPDAYLGIVFITDEEDCSAPADTDLFRATPDAESPNFVCAREGNSCRGMEIPARDGFSAPLVECRATEPGRSRLLPVRDLVDHVKRLKAPRNDRIIVSAIMGWPDDPREASYHVHKVPLVPDNDAPLGLDVAPVCQTGSGFAQPGLRLKEFVDAFGERFTSIHGICSMDLTPALERIGELIGQVIDPTCVDALLADTRPSTPEVDPECAIAERRPAGAGFQEIALPPCARSGGAKPCWDLERDPTCAVSGFRVEVRRDGAPPSGTILAMKCQACAGERDPRCPRAR